MPWSEATQAKYRRTRDHRQNNLTDEEWLLIEPMIPKQGRMGRQRKRDPRHPVRAGVGVSVASTTWLFSTVFDGATTFARGPAVS